MHTAMLAGALVGAVQAESAAAPALAVARVLAPEQTLELEMRKGREFVKPRTGRIFKLVPSAPPTTQPTTAEQAARVAAQIIGRQRERGAVQVTAPHQDAAGIVGHVQPFVEIERQRVRPLNPG